MANVIEWLRERQKSYRFFPPSGADVQIERNALAAANPEWAEYLTQWEEKLIASYTDAIVKQVGGVVLETTTRFGDDLNMWVYARIDSGDGPQWWCATISDIFQADPF